jgi:hypothetical protein
VGKEKVNKYPTAFRKMALERLKTCRNATELAAEPESARFFKRRRAETTRSRSAPCESTIPEPHPLKRLGWLSSEEQRFPRLS